MDHFADFFLQKNREKNSRECNISFILTATMDRPKSFKEFYSQRQKAQWHQKSSEDTGYYHIRRTRPRSKIQAKIQRSVSQPERKSEESKTQLEYKVERQKLKIGKSLDHEEIKGEFMCSRKLFLRIFFLVSMEIS